MTIETLWALPRDVHGLTESCPATRCIPLVPRADYDALAARLAEWAALLMEAPIYMGTPLTPVGEEAAARLREKIDRALAEAGYTADSASVCLRCHGTGAIDTATSADDPSCPDCDGEGVKP